MGKSTCAEFLQARGAAVVDTDDLARQIVEPGQPALAEIQTAFGPQVIGKDGRLQRDLLAQVVFADPGSRKKLEAILHPRIRELWKAQLEAWRAEGRKLAVVVIPLLFETKVESQFDSVICAACSAATQRARLGLRGWTPAQIEQRIAAQLPVEEKLLRSQRVVWTEGGLDVHEEQVARMVAPVN